jgi:hypothetical protein
MFYVYGRRVCVFLLFTVTAIFFSQDVLIAKDIVINRTGIIRITKPDGIVLRVENDQALPEIPSGSKVEVITGSIGIEPAEGFIQVVVGDSVAMVKVGDILTASMDLETNMADFEALAGQIRIITGNTTTIVNSGQKVKISLDKRTAIVEVRSIKGTIGTITAGVKALVPQDATGRISVDAKTRKVRVEAINGYVQVMAIDGEVIMLAKAESMDTEASAVGEIQTFAEEAIAPFVPVEEPAEPERPEASPHRP